MDALEHLEELQRVARIVKSTKRVDTLKKGVGEISADLQPLAHALTVVVKDAFPMNKVPFDLVEAIEHLKRSLATGERAYAMVLEQLDLALVKGA